MPRSSTYVNGVNCFSDADNEERQRYYDLIIKDFTDPKYAKYKNQRKFFYYKYNERNNPDYMLPSC